MKKKISVVIADSYPFIRESLFDLVKNNYDAEIFLAPSAREAIELVSTKQTDVLLLDFPMQNGDGFKVIAQIQKLKLSTRIVVLTDSYGEAMISNLLRLNIHGILCRKLVHLDEIRQAMDAVLEKKYYYHEKVKAMIQAKPNFIQDPPRITVSRRELEIMVLLSEGKHTKEIADRLFLSQHTIEGYRKDLLKKTRTRNTTELIAYSMRNGMISY